MFSTNIRIKNILYLRIYEATMYVESKVSRDKRLPLKFANTYIYICIEELITIRVQEIQEKR